MTSKTESTRPRVNITEPMTLGLDIGIASVGWAVLTPTRVVGLGVRAFDKAETAKEGESLNLARRTARLLRRRLYRRAWRLTKLGRLLKRSGLLPSARFFKFEPSFYESTWELRVRALDALMTDTEFARIVYHLCKHRGFHWVSRAEERAAESDDKSADKEAGKVKAGLRETKRLMVEKNYRSAAEMVLREFPLAQRNKRGDYSKALSRVLLADEFEKIFVAQRLLGSSVATEALQEAILGKPGERGGLFWEQKPALSGANLLKMLGKCTFEREEYRAPKASFTAERHVWLTRLNNLRVIVDGTARPLTEDEHRAALLLPYYGAEKFTYKTLKMALIKLGALPENVRFASLAYPSKKQVEEDKAKNPEDTVLVKLPAWHELRLGLKKDGLESEWQQISLAAIEGEPAQLDAIAWVLSVFKDDAEVQTELAKLHLPGGQRMVDSLLNIRFDKFHALSLKALRQIVPLMATGLRYDEAVARIPAYGHHSQLVVLGASGTKYLPPFYKDERNEHGGMVFRDDIDIPRNPVVLRALNQARKVVNALIKAYGSPHAVHIELARDLSRPLDERKEVKALQDEFKARNERAREQFADDFGRAPNGAEFEKSLLYREQQGKCAYSMEPLDLDRVINDRNYAQVDHVLPYSRSYDDSRNNKVLVHAAVNQRKGNRTPYEFLDGAADSAAWHAFQSWVEGNKAYRQAKRSRLLRKNFGGEEAQGFRDRNLNDTRYICKFFKNYVETNLQLAEESDAKRCVVVSGQLTAFLRARWGLAKIRSESDRHHAMDAAVVAACSHAMVKNLGDYARRKELQFLHEGFVDPETGEILNRDAHERNTVHFPEPWAHFRHELNARLKTDDVAALREDLQRLGTYTPEELLQVKPLFVSRAPQRRNGGAVHKETIYGQPEHMKADGSVTQKVALSSLTLKHFGDPSKPDDEGSLVEPHRNVALYAGLRQRLEAFGGKADKAFADDNPFYKPDKHGEPTGPIVRTVTAVVNKLSGIPIRGGVARNDTMLRVDVFSKAGKFHLVPIYVHHRVTGLPNRAIVAAKDEAEWTLIDESFAFLFSLSGNDFVRLAQKGKQPIAGYFGSCHRGTGNINLWAHDRSEAVGKGGAIDGLGVKTAISFEKMNVDVLGNTYPAPRESRRGLA